MEFYIDEKQKQRKKKAFKLKIYAGLAIFLLMVGGASYLIIYSSVFKIKNIIIAGNISSNKFFIESKLGQVADELKSFFGGQSQFAAILGADNIFIWKNNVEEFLKSHPEITDLSIDKNYIDREVKIQIFEREKFGVWCALNNDRQPMTNNCWWFDKDGVIFEISPIIEGEMIYKVNDFSGRNLILGERAAEKNIFENLLKIFDVLQKADLKIKTIYLENLDLQEVSVKLSHSPIIYFSLRFDPVSALPAINSLAKDVGLGKIEYIDLRVENRVYYKLK